MYKTTFNKIAHEKKFKISLKETLRWRGHWNRYLENNSGDKNKTSDIPKDTGLYTREKLMVMDKA